jgi:ADP-ribosylation factor GTPase-activating protein 1
MDSWTPVQLNLMKAGGNSKCAAFLKQKGVDPSSPIKQKYESPAAQLYKEILKARVEGRPEPTELPKVAPRSGTYSPSPSSGGFGSLSPKPGEDPNGMERLTGETDQQYIARQTRLRDEARQRMAAKFSGGGGMGGVGSTRMAGIGSNPNYNPNAGYSSDLGVDSLVAGFGSALSSIGSVAKGAAASASSLIKDEQIQSLGGSMWNTLSSTVSSVAATLKQPDVGDGLEDFNRQMASQRSATGSKYSGFGSDTMTRGNGMDNGSSLGGRPPSVAIQEAPGAPGEDRNGIERLTGETDEQYVMRQTRLREEAKARMAAKFGGGGLSSASSTSSSSMSFAHRPPAAGSDSRSARPTPLPSGSGFQSAPTSSSWGAVSAAPQKAAPVKLKVESNEDFFASFGA